MRARVDAMRENLCRHGVYPGTEFVNLCSHRVKLSIHRVNLCTHLIYREKLCKQLISLCTHSMRTYACGVCAGLRGACTRSRAACKVTRDALIRLAFDTLQMGV